MSKVLIAISSGLQQQHQSRHCACPSATESVATRSETISKKAVVAADHYLIIYADSEQLIIAFLSNVLLNIDQNMLRSKSSGSVYEPTQAELKEMCMAYYLLAAVGIGYIFAFSALTQPVDYWNHMFPNFNVEFGISTLYVWVNLIVLAAIVAFGGDPIIKSRMNIGFYGQLFTLLIIPTSWFLDLSEIWNYWLVMGCTTFVAVVTAFTASAAISLTSQYPPEVQAGYQLGIGLSTLIGSIFRILTKVVVPDSMVVESSLLYFYGSAAAIGGCIVAYQMLQRLELSHKHVTYGLDPKSQFSMQVTMTPVVSYDALVYLEHSAEQGKEVVLVSMPNAPGRPRLPSGFQDNTFDFELIDIGYAPSAEIESGNIDRVGTPSPVRSEGSWNSPTCETSYLLQANDDYKQLSKLEIFIKVIPPLCSVFLVFGTTLVLWPSVVTEIKSYDFPYLEETKWWSLILLFIFALADCVGRFIVEYRKYVTKDTIWILALLRLFLIPPLICCAEGWWVFTSDAWSMCLVAVLGVSNGYLGSISIILVNDYTSSKQEAGIAGVFTGFVINLSLATGATISLCLHDTLLQRVQA